VKSSVKMPTASAGSPLIALTGATGFIGRYLVRELIARGYRVRILLRRPSPVPLDCSSAVIGDLSQLRNMKDAFQDIHFVIHTAGVAHAMSGIPEDDYRTLNTEATIELARSAMAMGVKRFFFLSSVRAQCGPSSAKILTEDDEPAPVDAYGRSKLEAEQGLSKLELDWVALRLPLTYGPGVKGNFSRLARLAESPYPLPLGGLSARRSILSLDNLASAVQCVLAHEQSLRRPLLVADPEAVSLPELVRSLRQARGRGAGLLPVPQLALRVALDAAGRSEEYARLAEPLIVSTARLQALGWQPRVSTREGLTRYAQSAQPQSN
jgi:nucleoside-diphosphate-sugar epimerase